MTGPTCWGNDRELRSDIVEQRSESETHCAGHCDVRTPT